jgi:hypothetical protein
MLCTKGRGATSTPKPGASARSGSAAAKLRPWILVTGIVAVVAVGLAACGSDAEPGPPASTGGAGGSDSPPGSDASRTDDAAHGDGAMHDDVGTGGSSNVDVRADRDATSTTDASGENGGSDGMSTVDVGVDASSDGSVVDRGGSLDIATEPISMDAAREASVDARTDLGTSDEGGSCGCTAYGTPTVTGTEPASLTELSGIVASRKNPGVLYAHNDSGSNSTLIVISDTAAPLGQITLSGVNAVDWEDVAVGPCDVGSCIFVGEIGDNNLAYATRTVYRFAEPAISPTTPIGTMSVTADALTFVYPDGRHNAETLLVEPNSGDIFVITKVSNVPSTVYRLPKPFTPGTQATVEKVGDLSLPGSAGLVTGGDVHPCGTRMLIRTYPMIYEFKLGAGQPFTSIFASTGTPVSTPTQDQESKGEGVTYAADGIGYFTASELDGKSSRSLFRMRCQ